MPPLDMRSGLPVARCRNTPAVNGVGVAAEHFALMDDKEASGEREDSGSASDWAFAAGLLRHALSAFRSIFCSIRSSTS